MKYIRTKDGRIIDLTFYKENGIINNGIKFVHKLNGSYFFVQQDNIINQADTIEELCDELVLVGGNAKPSIIDNITAVSKYVVLKDKSFELWEKLTKENCKIFGAIWTDKGLIYVAKLNERGEWKLL